MHLSNRLLQLATLSASVVVTSCAAAWDAGDVPHWPESPGEIAIYARPAVNTFVQIDRLTVSVDGDAPRVLPSNGETVSVRLTPGPHRIEVVGAFRRCLYASCNGAWTFWRRADARVELHGACLGVVRVDIYDESRPLGWEPEAPMMDLHQRTRCDAPDPQLVGAAHRAQMVVSTSAIDAQVAAGMDAASNEPVIEIGSASPVPVIDASFAPSTSP